MKSKIYLVILVFIMFYLVPLFAVDEFSGTSIPLGDTVTIPVDFVTSGTDVVMGFSKNRVTSFAQKDDDITSIGFVPNRNRNVFSTGSFYFYAQIFTQTPIKIIVTSASAISSGNTSIDWTNKGDSSTSLPNSNTTGGILYQENAGAADLQYPRITNIEFNFEIPFDSLNEISTTEISKLEGTMIIKVEGA